MVGNERVHSTKEKHFLFYDNIRLKTNIIVENYEGQKVTQTHQHLHLVEVLGLAVGVLHLLGEDQVELKEEHAALPTLPDQLLWVPHLESILQKRNKLQSRFRLQAVTSIPYLK
jgi:hypothetical protein